MVRFVTAIFVTALAGASALAQAPLSAIDWLSESINNPPEFEVTPDSTPLVEPVIQHISIKKGLTPVSPDALGLLSPTLTGFSANLWGDMPAIGIADIISTHPNMGSPEAKALFQRILLAQANPAPDDIQNGLVLRARVDRLIEFGALDAAEALIDLSPTSNPDIFEQKFNIAILTDRTTEVCDILQEVPAITDDLSARVYCLARSGDWNAAAITLSLGASIGSIETAREEMLIRFLDPSLFDGEPDPAAPEPLGIMDFVLREAVLLPRPSGLMPLPYLYRDIGKRAPLRARIEASERLVGAGTLPSSLLFTAYREGKAASSGGVWGRANAVQSLDNALSVKDPTMLSDAITEAFAALDNADLLAALAEEFSDKLGAIDYSPELADIKHQMFDLLHLAGISNIEWTERTVLDANRQMASAIVTKAPLTVDPTSKPMLQSIVNGLNGTAPDNTTAIRLLKMLEDNQQGQAILASLRLLSSGALSDPEAVRTGLYVLTAAGQSASARKIAVQILLLPAES